MWKSRAPTTLGSHEISRTKTDYRVHKWTNNRYSPSVSDLLFAMPVSTTSGKSFQIGLDTPHKHFHVTLS